MRIRTTAAAALILLAGTMAAQERPRLQQMKPGDIGMRTGPDVGERIPAFSAPDQNGKKQTFETLKGENGMMLVFVRSVDW